MLGGNKRNPTGSQTMLIGIVVGVIGGVIVIVVIIIIIALLCRKRFAEYNFSIQFIYIYFRVWLKDYTSANGLLRWFLYAVH